MVVILVTTIHFIAIFRDVGSDGSGLGTWDNIYPGFKILQEKVEGAVLHVSSNTLHRVGGCARLSQRSIGLC